MKYITSPALISINQEINASILTTTELICRIECYQIESDDLENFHSPSSYENGPSSSSYDGDRYRINPVYDLVSYASAVEYPALRATLAHSFPDFDFSSLCPWNFKIIKNPEQARDTINWSLSTYFQNSDITMSNIWKTIDATINISESQIFRYEPDGSDVFSDMGYTTTYSYFFVHEQKNKVLFLHAREGSGDDQMSDCDSLDLIEKRFGPGVF